MNGTNGIKKCEQTYTVTTDSEVGNMSYVDCLTMNDTVEWYLIKVRDTVMGAVYMKAVDDRYSPLVFGGKTYKLSETLPMADILEEGREIIGDELINARMKSWSLGHTFKSKYQDKVSVHVNLLTEDGVRLWIESEWNCVGYKHASDDEGNAWVVQGKEDGTYQAVMVRNPTEQLADMGKDIGDWMFTLGLFRIEGVCLQYERMEFVHDYMEYLQRCAELELDGYTAFRPAIDTERCELDRTFIKESE